jgi:negative regulator of flagellin synthesis FlgM
MNIGRISQIAEQYHAPQVRKTVEKRTKTGKDDIQISSEGKLLDSCKKMAAQIPNVREDKVSALMQRIESGKYNVSAALVAQKMLENV